MSCFFSKKIEIVKHAFKMCREFIFPGLSKDKGAIVKKNRRRRSCCRVTSISPLAGAINLGGFLLPNLAFSTGITLPYDEKQQDYQDKGDEGNF